MNMAAVQQHGLEMERILGSAYLGHDVPATHYTSVYDIPANIAPDGRPVSIKTAKINASGGTICLGDARRIWANVATEEMTLICGTYTQVAGFKAFTRVHEIVITPDIARRLLGTVTPDQVARFHDTLLEFPQGSHVAARRWARAVKVHMKDREGLITLNPKIDSKRQRRLQCSVILRDLLALPGIQVTTYDVAYRDLALPIRIASGLRQFNA